MGGLSYSNKKRWVELSDKGNSHNFYKMLKIFYEELTNEWVSANTVYLRLGRL
jgi:hypothetical protein